MDIFVCLFYSNSIQYLLRKKWLINAPERNNVSSVKLSKEYISTPNKNGFVFYLVLYSWTFSFPFVEIRKSKLHSILCILPLFQSKVSYGISIVLQRCSKLPSKFLDLYINSLILTGYCVWILHLIFKVKPLGLFSATEMQFIRNIYLNGPKPGKGLDYFLNKKKARVTPAIIQVVSSWFGWQSQTK